MTPTPSHIPHPFHRGEGRLMGFGHDNGKGGEGRPGTWNTCVFIYIHIYINICTYEYLSALFLPEFSPPVSWSSNGNLAGARSS